MQRETGKQAKKSPSALLGLESTKEEVEETYLV